jgi:hypothetical protein
VTFSKLTAMALLGFALTACAADVSDDEASSEAAYDDDVELGTATSAMMKQPQATPGGCPAEPGSFECVVWKSFNDGSNPDPYDPVTPPGWTACVSVYQHCKAACPTPDVNQSCHHHCDDSFERCVL